MATLSPATVKRETLRVSLTVESLKKVAGPLTLVKMFGME